MVLVALLITLFIVIVFFFLHVVDVFLLVIVVGIRVMILGALLSTLFVILVLVFVLVVYIFVNIGILFQRVSIALGISLLPFQRRIYILALTTISVASVVNFSLFLSLSFRLEVGLGVRGEFDEWMIVVATFY